MLVDARMTVSEGVVICPRTGHKEDVGHCAECVNLVSVDKQGDSQFVECLVEVADLAETIEVVMRA